MKDFPSEKTKKGRIIEYDGVKIYGDTCTECPSIVDPWITQFSNLPQNRFFVAVDREWAREPFNSYGIGDKMKQLYKDNMSSFYYKYAFQLINDQHDEKWSDFSEEEICKIHIAACRVYGLMHSRYIMQPEGLDKMKRKYEKAVYGKCPRYYCYGNKLLPVGVANSLRKRSVKLFCPCCCDIYNSSPDNCIDGAYFGTAFPHLFLFEFPQFDTSDKLKFFRYKVFGFRVHNYPRKPVHNRNIYDDDYINNNDAKKS